MTVTFSLGDVGKTHRVAVHDGVPRGVPPADNDGGGKCRSQSSRRSSRAHSSVDADHLRSLCGGKRERGRDVVGDA
jgi:hypothetical protein